MIEIFGVAIAAIVPLVGALVWLVRLEGRMNVSDARLSVMKERIDSLEERIVRQLDRIEAKLENKVSRTDIEIAR